MSTVVKVLSMRDFCEDALLWVENPLSTEPIVLIDVDDLQESGSPRAGVDLRHVRMLASVLEAVPPIVVDKSTFRVIDGVHRLRAARVRGWTQLPARMVDLDADDAFVAAVRINTRHGLPLCLADRKAAAATILGTHRHWSDRMVAAVSGLSAKTVAGLRSGDPAVRIGLDGKARPSDGAKRRRVVARMLTEHPAMSLRQVARAVGVSPETVRSVKARMGRKPAEARTKHPSRGVPARTDVPAIVRRLRSDPSLRFTDAGRDLLRLLAAHAIDPARWESIAGSVPPHCRGAVAALAAEVSRTWQTLADQVEEVAE